MTTSPSTPAPDLAAPSTAEQAPLARGQRFTYLGYAVDPAEGVVTCRYALDDHEFSERVAVPGAPAGAWSTPAADAAARLVFLLAGVSYYKAGAPPVIDLGGHAVTPTERAFLLEYHLDGLGEFAHRNGLDLSGLVIEGPSREAAPVAVPGVDAASRAPLVPFGGGVDSIVSVELLRELGVEPALFVVNRPGDRFEAIEEPAAVAGLPVIRAERTIDPLILRSRELGFLNGHVPVTGIISAIAVLAAVVHGRDAVVMSNEWSASSATLVVDGRSINHQYSKSEEFESGLRVVLAETFAPVVDYFSLLRPFTELWIAKRFARLEQYFSTFRSCNRAFHIDPAKRAATWCGRCDKCAFIDLILSPYVPAEALRAVFGGAEPLEDDSLLDTFRTLLAVVPDAKPWECVGDESECRIAARMAAARPDREGNRLLKVLLAQAAPFTDPDPEHLLTPVGRHHVPARYAPRDLLG
ncbi:MAG: hypothetical protein U0Q15_19240 [Kineosporiaceae bacterium]